MRTTVTHAFLDLPGQPFMPMPTKLAISQADETVNCKSKFVGQFRA